MAATTASFCLICQASEKKNSIIKTNSANGKRKRLLNLFVSLQPSYLFYENMVYKTELILFL